MDWSCTPLPETILSIVATAAHSGAHPPVTVDTIQHLNHARELFRTHGARGEPTPIEWHRKLPLLATGYDGDWWTITGERVATFIERGSGTWSANGLRFLVQDFHPEANGQLDDFHTRQRYRLALPPETKLLLNPRFPLLLLGSSEAIIGWQIGSQQTYRFQDSQGCHVRYPFWTWSPDGEILTITTYGRQIHPSSLRETRLQFWTRDGTLIADHTRNLPYVGTWHWRPDSRIVISCHQTHLCWWDRAGNLLAAHTIADRGVGSYHADQYVAWHPSGQMIAVLGDREFLLFDAGGAMLAAYPLPLGCSGSCLVWHPTGTMLSVGDWASCIHTWAADGTLLHSLQTWERLSSFRVPFMLAWSADGSCLAVSSRDCRVYLYTLRP
ncbi:MAG TPA: WD40 repeat domain-containing protein [Herpetosiphonaceae bacterium]|nr:WD40 repeat domain-containing protein [Herpetosiphonaceae bacterium]